MSSSTLRELTRPASAPFRVGASSPIRPVMRDPLAEEPASGPGFLLPFGRRRSLLGSSCVRWGFRFPYGRPTRPNPPSGPQRGCHVPHETDTTGVGVLCTPGTVVRSRPARSLRSAPAASQRPVPVLPLKQPIDESANDEASSRLHVLHPSGLPQPVAPGWNRSPWALPRASHPAVTRDARRGGDGPCALDRALHHRHSSTLLR